MRMKLKAAFLLLSALATAALAAPFPANKDASGGLKAAINALNAAGLLNNAAACSSDPNCANDPFDASRPRCGYAGCTNPPYWDVSQVTNMYELFEDMTGNRMDVSGWDTSSVTNMGRMFHRNFAFNGDISAWDVSKVTNMKSMFGGARAFNRPIGKWDVSSVQDCREMFVNAWEFNQPIGNWDTSSATRMSNMFQKAYKFKQDVRTWDVSKVTTFAAMFSEANAWKARYVNCGFDSSPSACSQVSTGAFVASAAALDGPPRAWIRADGKCDAAFIVGGSKGTCTDSLAPGSTCFPACDGDGFSLVGEHHCVGWDNLSRAECVPSSCDASAAPTNGGVGDCTSSLASGSTCQPTCDIGYTVSGTSSCSFGTLTAARCSIPSRRVEFSGLGAPSNRLVRPPRITRLEPPKGHVSGGTTVTIRGRGFVRSTNLRVRFADENAVDEVRGTWVSSGEVTCVTPARSKAATAQVTVSNGDGSWSAPPLVYVAGSGTALTFIYDDSPPGCQGCTAPGGFQAALSPWERARERWESDVDAGPDVGGTTVHISSANGRLRVNAGVRGTAVPSPPSPPLTPPVSVPTPDLHLVADDVVNVDSSNLIQSWSDHNGNGLSLNAFAGKPTLVDGGDIDTGALFNGHKAVRFGKSGVTGLSLGTSALRLSTSLEGITIIMALSVDTRAPVYNPFLLNRGHYGDKAYGMFVARGSTYLMGPCGGGSCGWSSNTSAPIENGEMYVVTARIKFKKGGVDGEQFMHSQHGDMSNPDLIASATTPWTGSGVDYNYPYVIGAQSKSAYRSSGRWFQGYLAEFRYYHRVLDQDEMTAIQDELLDKYQEWCDASVPPTNGGAGNCTDKLMRGAECQPTCDEDYFASGASTCDQTGFTAATCEPVHPIGVGTGSTLGHRYWVPNGGPGLGGKVFDVDPASPGNGPPVTGTFYPSQRLTCMFTCPLVVVTNASNSSNVTANSTSGSYADQSAYHASLRRAEEGSPAAAASSFTGDGDGSFAVTSASASDGTVVSARVKARWLDYTRVSCVSPPRPAPSEGFRARTLSDGSLVHVDASRRCVVTVSNDGVTFDDYYAHGGSIGGTHDADEIPMPNAAAVTFTYATEKPTVSSISSSHRVRPEALEALGLPPARGPFAGGTTITVRGGGFLQSGHLRCRFEDDVTGFPPFVTPATYVSEGELTCETPQRTPRKVTRGPKDGTDPYPGDDDDVRTAEVVYDETRIGTISPCFVSAVSIANDGMKFSDASPGSKFLYCDLYASATADTRWSDSSTRAGTPNDPFHDLQSALHAALRGARVDAEDRRGPNEGSAPGDKIGSQKKSSVRWLNKDVVRLSPGVYRGEGNVALAMDAQLVDIVAGEPDDWPDVENVRSPGVPTATVDCREVDQVRGNQNARGSVRLFASQRVQVGGTPSWRPDGTGAIVGDGAVAFKGVSIERCFDDGGFSGASCSAVEGRSVGGCRGDSHYVAPELPGHASGGYATDPDVWEEWEYEDDDARYVNEASWYDYEA